MWDYSCGCSWLCLGVVGLFVVVVFPARQPRDGISEPWRGSGHGTGNLGQGWGWPWPRRGNSALFGGDAPSPSFIPAGHGVNTESLMELCLSGRNEGFGGKKGLGNLLLEETMPKSSRQGCVCLPSPGQCPRGTATFRCPTLKPSELWSCWRLQ